ncbi:uncharacterized protein LOC120334632 isoform X1 [Styela clava]
MAQFVYIVLILLPIFGFSEIIEIGDALDSDKKNALNNWIPLAILPTMFLPPCEDKFHEPMCLDSAPKNMKDLSDGCDIVTCLSMTLQVQINGKNVTLLNPVSVFGWKCREPGSCLSEKCTSNKTLQCFIRRKKKWCPKYECRTKRCERKQWEPIANGLFPFEEVTVKYPCGCECVEIDYSDSDKKS